MKVLVALILTFCICSITLAYKGLQPLPLSRKAIHRRPKPSVLHVSEVLANTEAFTDAFVGGTIGVMSVAFIVELRKTLKDQSLEGCPYCLGNGEILCASCCGCKIVAGQTCEVCGGRGIVMCLNCKGDGRITPIILQSKAIRDPEFATDSISIDSP